MTKYLATLLLLVTMSIPAFSQTETIRKASNRASNLEDMENYERMLKSQLNVDLRAVAINTLELDAKQISDFTPIYLDYVRSKESITARRNVLVNQYIEEMAEDDTRKDEMNETGDFIEDYWELKIADMELKKDYFDRLEDAITPMKALKFFEVEEMFNNRMNRIRLMETVPTFILLEPVTYTYEPEITAFNNWKKINIDGKLCLDHEFTHNGLEKLLTAAEAMTKAEGVTVTNFATSKASIMEKADMLQKNWKSLKHADYAREAFTMTADLLGDIANSERFEANESWIKQLKTQAKAIRPEVKLTDQADEVHAFFTTAEYIVNDLVEQANSYTK